jgi:hypothetical protein
MTIIIIKFRCKWQFQDLVGVIFVFGWKMSPNLETVYFDEDFWQQAR